jgi:hypothetical protein
MMSSMNAGHDPDQRQSGDAEAGDDARHNYDKRAGGAANLHERAAQCGDDKSGYDRGVEPGLRRDSGGNGKGHGQRQSDQANGDSCCKVTREFRKGVAAKGEHGLRKPLRVRPHIH